MKKSKKFLAVAVLTAFCGISMGSLGACDFGGGTEDPEEHEHSYTEWQYDATGHWKKCADDDATSEQDNHNFVDGVCECGYQQPAPEVKYGSAHATVHLVKGSETITDYSDVVVAIDDELVETSLDPATGALTISKLVAGKDYSLTISKPNYISYEVTISVDENEDYAIGGDDGISLRYDSVDMTYTVTNGAGYTATLYKGEEVVESKVIGADNTVTFEELSSKNTYKMSINVFGVELEAKEVNVDSDGVGSVDFSSHFNGNVTPASTIVHSNANGYKMLTLNNLNVTGDCALAGKFKIDRRSDMSKEIRLGLYIQYGGQKLPITFLIEKSKWRIQEMEIGWQGFDMSANDVSALEGDGLILAIYRNVEKGEIYVYTGASEDSLVRSGTIFANASDHKKNAVTQVGFVAWGNGDFTATVENIQLGSCVGEAVGYVKEVNISCDEVDNGSVEVIKGEHVYDDFVIAITPDEDCVLKSLTINGADAIANIVDGKVILNCYKAEELTIVPVFEKTYYGEVNASAVIRKHTGDVTIADGTVVKLNGGALGTYDLTVSEGKVSGRLPVGTYSVSTTIANVQSVSLEVTQEGVSEIALGYQFMGNQGTQGWGGDHNDYSHTNDLEDPYLNILNKGDGSVMYLSTDSYQDFVYTLQVKKSNSNNQGIWIYFENDAKNTYVKIGYENNNVIWKAGDGWGAVISGAPTGTILESANNELALKVLRNANKLYVYVDDVLCSVGILPEGYATKSARIGGWAAGSVKPTQYHYTLSTSVSITEDVTISKEDSENGSISLNKDSYVLGDIVNVEVSVNAGYIIETLTVDGADVTAKISNGVYSFMALKNEHSIVLTVKEKTEIDVEVGIVGHKYGVTGNALEGQKITLDGGAVGSYELTVTEGKVSETLPYGTYTVSANGYISQGNVVVSAEGISVESVTLEYDLMYNVVTSEWGWGAQADLSKQNDGVVVKPVGANNDCMSVATKESYDQVAITSNAVLNGGGRQGAYIKFNKDYVMIQVEPGKDANAGKYKVTVNGSGVEKATNLFKDKWDDMPGYSFSAWTEDMTNKVNNGTFEYTLVRDGANVYVVIDGNVVYTFMLSTKYATQKCQVGIYITSVNKDITFERAFNIESDISAYTLPSETFIKSGALDQSTEGVLKINTTTEQKPYTYDCYSDITATFTIKSNGHARNGFVLLFEDGKVLRYDINVEGTAHQLQRTAWSNIDGYGWAGIDTNLDVEKYTTDGISFKLVRSGASVKVWYTDADGNTIGDPVINETLSAGYADDMVRFGFNVYQSIDISYTISHNV